MDTFNTILPYSQRIEIFTTVELCGSCMLNLTFNSNPVKKICLFCFSLFFCFCFCFVLFCFVSFVFCMQRSLVRPRAPYGEIFEKVNSVHFLMYRCHKKVFVPPQKKVFVPPKKVFVPKVSQLTKREKNIFASKPFDLLETLIKLLLPLRIIMNFLKWIWRSDFKFG